jgi:hypothetical protein
MSDPNLALWLYIAIIFTQFLASPTWGRVREAITTATTAKATKSASVGGAASDPGTHA